MHIAFDGGCFQQGILGGIYQVARGFLNAARTQSPDLRLTLVCDPRQGVVRPEALAGLTWQPEILYASVARAYDSPEPWPAVVDPEPRFFVDGVIVPAALAGGVARYVGPAPTKSFAIVSRAARPVDNGIDTDVRRLGIQVQQVTITRDGTTRRVSGHDRRLSTGFVDGAGGGRWTDGAGFIPLAFFGEGHAEVSVDVAFQPQERYAMQPGPGAEAIVAARSARRDAARSIAMADLSGRLRGQGCVYYFANHFTAVTIPGLINLAWVYDLIPILLPQYFHADARANFTENLATFARADRVYTISESTRTDLLARTGMPAAKAIAVPIAPSPGLHRREPDAVAPVLEAHGLRRGRYILCVATIEPRKNHMRLMQAYLKLRQNLAECPDLVFVGKMGWDFQQVLEFREQNDLAGVLKIFSDRSEDELACLYTGALFSAYVSVYEGFGLPIIESLACGCAVLTSDRSSMPEVAGPAATFANPYDVDSIAAGLLALATIERMRNSSMEAGRARVKHYTWDRCSRMILDDLRHLSAPK